MNKLIPSLMLFGLISFNITARSPAVDPIMAPSIEEYKEVPPEQAQGYNFDRKPSSKVNPTTHEKHDQSVLKVESAAEPIQSLDMLALFFILLPIVASSFAFYRFKVKSHNIEELENTHQDLNSSKDSDDHDIDFPKAS